MKEFTTMKIGGVADYFAVLGSEPDLFDAIEFARGKKLPIFVLGAGSNTVFPDTPYHGLVLKNEISGMKIAKKTGTRFLVESYSGEMWTTFVRFCIDNHCYGLENLAYIPGTVGAAPIQNIGAYGTEIEASFYKLDAVDLKTGDRREFYGNDCQFSYRHSIFKDKLKDRFFILKTTYSLSDKPNLNLEYDSVKNYMQINKIKSPTVEDLLRAIGSIRAFYIPNPVTMPNAGSFFKNPEVDKIALDKIRLKHPDIKSFKTEDGKFRIAGGWLLEKCGFKGFHDGKVGVYDRHALILVNSGHGDFKDLWNLIWKIKSAVLKNFDIRLEEEVNIVGITGKPANIRPKFNNNYVKRPYQGNSAKTLDKPAPGLYNKNIIAKKSN